MIDNSFIIEVILEFLCKKFQIFLQQIILVHEKMQVFIRLKKSSICYFRLIFDRQPQFL